MRTKSIISPLSHRISGPGAAALALVLVTVGWGSSFVIIKNVLTQLPISDFLTLRFLIAGIAVWAISPSAVRRLSATDRRRAVLLGLLYGSGQLLQGKGLETTSASVSGFVSGMYVVLTPLLAAVVLRQHVSRNAWMATALASLGLGLLALNGASIGAGVVITLVSAVAFAAHILATGRWSSATNFLGLTIIELFTVAALSGVVAAPGGIAVPHSRDLWLALLYMALVTGALALVVQTWAQSKLEPTRAAVVMTMEPVFAATFAVVFSGDVLGPRSVLGAALVLAAMYLVERAPADSQTPVDELVGELADEVSDGLVDEVVVPVAERDRPHPAVRPSARRPRRVSNYPDRPPVGTRSSHSPRTDDALYRRRRLALERQRDFDRRLGLELALELTH